MFATIADMWDFPLLYAAFVFCPCSSGKPFLVVFQSAFTGDFITDLVKTE